MRAFNNTTNGLPTLVHKNYAFAIIILHRHHFLMLFYVVDYIQLHMQKRAKTRKKNWYETVESIPDGTFVYVVACLNVGLITTLHWRVCMLLLPCRLRRRRRSLRARRRWGVDDSRKRIACTTLDSRKIAHVLRFDTPPFHYYFYLFDFRSSLLALFVLLSWANFFFFIFFFFHHFNKQYVRRVSQLLPISTINFINVPINVCCCAFYNFYSSSSSFGSFSPRLIVFSFLPVWWLLLPLVSCLEYLFVLVATCTRTIFNIAFDVARKLLMINGWESIRGVPMDKLFIFAMKCFESG